MRKFIFSMIFLLICGLSFGQGAIVQDQASGIFTDSSSWGGQLSPSDTTVQSALQKFNDFIINWDDIEGLQSLINISGFNNDYGYISQSEINWSEFPNAQGYITGINWDEILGDQSSIDLSGFNNDEGFISGINWDEIGGLQSSINVSGFNNDAQYISNVDINWSLGTVLNMIGINWQSFYPMSNPSGFLYQVPWSEGTTSNMSGINWQQMDNANVPADSDTLDTVTTRGATTTNAITTGDHTITGGVNATQIINANPTPIYGIDANTKLMLHNNGANGSTTITDSEITPKTMIIIGTGAISTSQSVFGGASYFSDGTNGNLLYTASHADFNLGTSDFAFQFRVRLSEIKATNNFINRMNLSTGAGSFALYQSGGNLTFAHNKPGYTTYSVAWTPSLNTWYSIAIVRNGANLNFYVDGVQVGATNNIGTASISSGTNVLGIAAGLYTAGWQSCLNGYIDEFRFSLGVPRYTGNYTTETQEFDAGVASGATPTTIYQNTSTDLWTIKSDGLDSDTLKTLDSTGTTRTVLTQTGLYGIGQSTPTARVHIKGAGATLATIALAVDNSADTRLMTVLDSGAVLIPALTAGRVPYATTGGQLADDADLTFDTDTLTATKLTVNGDITINISPASRYIKGSGSNDTGMMSGRNLNFVGNSYTPLRLFKGDMALTLNGHNLNIGAADDADLGFFVDRTAATTWRARGSGSTANPTMIRSYGGSLIFYTDTGISDLATYTPTARMRLNSTGLGLGVTTVNTALTIANDNYMSAKDNAGSSYVNMFKVNTSDQIDVGAQLNLSGYIEGPTDGGAITLFDMPVTSASADNTEMSATLKIGTEPVLKVYGESDGAGNADTLGVYISFGGTMKLVEEGAADSGGAGYKMLRVVN